LPRTRVHAEKNVHRSLSALCITFAVLGGCDRSSAERDRAVIAGLEDSLRAATVRADTAVLGALYAPEYLSTSAVGHTSSRDEALMAYRVGLVRADSARIGNLDIRVYDGTALAMGLLQWGGMAAGQPFAATARFQHVWGRQPEGRWQIVASQMTSQPPPRVP
jgi:ketosteroid isomerase-like protein